MRRVRHGWREACAAALGETHPARALGRIERTITALERRYAEWGSHPGTPAELTAIQNALSALQRMMNETLVGDGEAPRRVVGEISDVAQRWDKPYEALT
jgi:hypothetical protein